MRLLVVQHAADCPPAQVGRWLAEAGVDLDVVGCHAGDALPDSLDGHDGLLVLGGDMGAYDDSVAPWLPQTRRLLGLAIEREVPTLGICLGHQLLAVAAGGSVSPAATGQQIGVLPVWFTAEGRRDELFGPSGSAARAIHWNNDLVVEPPPGAVELARAQGGVQAMRLGRVVWGVQFHPEIGAAELGAWAEADVTAGRLDREFVEERLAAVATAEPELHRTWGAFAHRFAETVRRRCARRGPAPL